MAKPECRNLFDHLYAVFCNNLRELGKASSFCELIKNANSDLNRITALSKVCNIVLLIKSVKKCMKNNSKNVQRAQDILEMYYARKDIECSDSATDLIVLLNTALANITIDDELNFEQFKDFDNDETNFIESLLVNVAGKSPTVEETLLSDVHSERATHFYNVQEYEVCLLEALRGIFYAKINKDNPSEILFPLLYFVSASLWHLSRFKMALNVLQLSVKLLRLSTLDNTAKSAQTMKLVRLMKQVQISSKEAAAGTADQTLNLKLFLEPKHENLPNITGDTSDVLLGAYSGLELKWEADRGRHVVAKQTIPLGTTIIAERPFSSIIHSKNSFSFCQNCCHEVKNLVPCTDCSTVVFCSKECRSASQDYHRYECKFMKTLTSSEILGDLGLLCYRSICKTDLRVLQSHVLDYSTFQEGQGAEVADSLSKKFNLGLDESGQLDARNYTSLFVQTPNSTDRLGGDLLKKSFSAIFLTICLRFAGYFQPSDVTDIEHGKLYQIEQHVASLILRQLQSVSCNSCGINNINAANPRRLQINEIGVGTYPTISTMNHSCNSNVYRFTMGNACIVKTLREIQPGEEVVDSYGPHFASNSIEDRIRYLDGQYMFCCNCQPCVEDWSVYAKLPKDNLRLRCPQCDGESSASGKGKHICLKCSNSFDARKILKTVKDMEKKFHEAKQRLLSSNKMSTMDYEAVEGAVVRYANALEKIQKWPSQTLIECQEALKLCWNLEFRI